MHPDSLDGLLHDMQQTPWRYDFFCALRLIDARQPQRPRLGSARRPADEAVRLGQAPDLAFAPAALHAVSWPPGADKARIDVRFFGLFGPNGPLPLHLTEYARERLLHHRDETFARFADVFHHRLLLLFYRAWAQAQPVVNLDRPDDDHFAEFVGALAGIGAPALRQRDAAPDHAKLFFSGLLARQVRSADGLAALLSGWLRRPVQVEQFAGAWLRLAPSERTQLVSDSAPRRQRENTRLGAAAVLGAMVWDRQHHFRLHVGPLDHAAFAALLPGGSALPALAALAAQYVGDEFGWTLALTLKAAHIPTLRLGRQGRLGWDGWLGPPTRRANATVLLEPTQALQSLARRQQRQAAAAAARRQQANAPP